MEREGTIQLSGTKLWELSLGPVGLDPEAFRPRAFEVSYDVPVDGVEDGDYTQDCLDAGTTFSLTGAVQSTPIPVVSAIVKDGILTFKGIASWQGLDK